jgi:zinc transport system permease protein
MLITAMVIAIAMKIVGILLITALLIIPAATASKLSETPEQMAVLASSIATLSVALGLAMTWYLDTPAGPSVVISASCLFGISQVVGQRTS